MQNTTGCNIEFLDSGGDMGGLMRRHDWSDSPLGPPCAWPQSLRSLAGLMLNSKFPMFALWGKELACIYNDGYIPILGARHPRSLGRPFSEIWPEYWEEILPHVKRTLSGQATHFDNLPLKIENRGVPEKIWVTFSYSPIRDESGTVAGIFCTFTDITSQILAERRQAFQLELTDRLRLLDKPAEIKAVTAELLGRQLYLSRVGYGEIDAAGQTITIERDWTDTHVASLAGQSWQLQELGPAIVQSLRNGASVQLDDILADPGAAPYAASYASMNVRAVIAVPLIRSGRLAAILYLHQHTPRQWTHYDVALAEEVAGRTWATVERAHAESALKKRLLAEGERLRNLFEQAPGFMAILRGPDHVFEFANSAGLRLLRQHDVVGKPMREVLHAAEQQNLIAQLDQVYATGLPVSAYGAPLLVRPDADGFPPVQRYVDFIYQPILEDDKRVSGIFVEGYDVTARKQAGRALKASEARYRTLIETISAVIWRADQHGGLLPGNTSWESFTGQQEDEYLGQGWLKALHPEDRELIRQTWNAAIIQQIPYTTAFRLRRHDGQYRHVNFNCAPVRMGVGRIAEWIGNCEDVTQAKQTEEALQIADRKKDEFIAMLAHELRNPLAPISTSAKILNLIQTDEPRVKQAGEIITRQVMHMTKLIDDLLDVSSVARGLVTLERAALDLRQIVASAVEQVRPLLEKCCHRLTLQIAGQPVYVEGDRTRLVQVVANLLNNAAKYTPEGGEIALDIETSNDQVNLHIRDNGMGIAREMLPEIFNLFIQAQPSSSRSHGGLGIGLALVKNLVRLHGGQVTADSQGVGRGSEFVVTLPLLQQNVQVDAPDASPAAIALPGAPLQVMIVDDNEDAAQSLRILLETHGHQVSVEYNPLSALERARVAAPQALLIDIGLPVMDGCELARQLRAMPQVAHATLIALTGFAQDQARTKAAGFDYHLSKPADESRLIELLCRIQPPVSSRAAITV